MRAAVSSSAVKFLVILGTLLSKSYHRIKQMNQLFLAISAALMALALRIEARR